MKLLTKSLGMGEAKYKVVLVPRAKKDLFPPPDQEFDLHEGEAVHKAKVDRQYRLRVPSFFRRHRSIKQGDEVTLSSHNGRIYIALSSRGLTGPEKGIFAWAREVLDSIEIDEVQGIIQTTRSGFTVEIGEHIKQTQIVVGTK